MKHPYEYRKGFDIIEKGEAEMQYIRRRGLELAKEHKAKIREYVHNERTNKWEDLGYCTPDNHYVNIWGDICELEEDGRNFKIVGKIKA